MTKTTEKKPSFDSLIESLHEVKEQARKSGKELLQQAFGDIFEKYPEVQSVRWAQYTPYFNDGAACVFGIDNFQVLLSAPKVPAEEPEEPYDEDENDVDEDDGWVDLWSVSSGKLLSKEALDVLSKMEKQLTDNAEIVETIFGNDCQVTVSRESTTVDSYDHD